MDSKTHITLGLIGYSPGNGHPYSWSAIFNGFNAEAMSGSGYPTISEYLARQLWPDDSIDSASVDYVWCDDMVRARHVAEASLVPKVVSDPALMIEVIDGLLLARDDSENHLGNAKPFLEAGIPVYIDKPIATSVDEFEKILDFQMYDGQIFTCSAIRYSNEMIVSQRQLADLGRLVRIDAVGPGSWAKYSIHLIEPVLNILGFDCELTNHKVIRTHLDTCVSFKVDGIRVSLSTVQSRNVGPIAIKITGKKSVMNLVFTDSFQCFKSALLKFLDAVRYRSPIIPRYETSRVVEIIELGMEDL